MTCSFCREPVSENTAYQRVEGWTKPRAAGGANQITLRELQPQFCCYACMAKLRAGLDPNQSSLW